MKRRSIPSGFRSRYCRSFRAQGEFTSDNGTKLPIRDVRNSDATGSKTDMKQTPNFSRYDVAR